MGKVEIEESDDLPRPPALVCFQECEDVRRAQLGAKIPELQNLSKFANVSGKLKIVVVNPTPCKDCMEQFWSAVLSLATMLIGIVVFAILIFSVGDYMNDLGQRLDKLHVPFCTIGFVMFSGPGIMSINSVYGPSAKMKPKERKRDHIVIVAVGFFFAIVGGIICFSVKDNIQWSGIHCVAGLVSYVLGVFSIGTGIAAVLIEKTKILIVLILLHQATGMLAFLAYVGCFVTGILSRIFKRWAREIISWYYWVLVAMVVFSTILILFVPLLKCCITFTKCRKVYKHKCTKAETAAYILAQRQQERHLKEIEEEKLEEEKQRETNALTYQKPQKLPFDRHS